MPVSPGGSGRLTVSVASHGLAAGELLGGERGLGDVQLRAEQPLELPDRRAARRRRRLSGRTCAGTPSGACPVWRVEGPVAGVGSRAPSGRRWSAARRPAHSDREQRLPKRCRLSIWSTSRSRVEERGGRRGRTCSEPASGRRPSRSAKNMMKVAATRRQPVTALEYDKPTPSLSCAYGVSCRARAERVCATPHLRRFAPRAALTAQQLVPPLRLGVRGRTRLGVLAAA